MEPTLYMIALDQDGHFILKDSGYRPGILALLRELESPELDENPSSDREFYEMDEAKWKEFLRGFVQRGRIELVEVTA